MIGKKENGIGTYDPEQALSACVKVHAISYLVAAWMSV